MAAEVVAPEVVAPEAVPEVSPTARAVSRFLEAIKDNPGNVRVGAVLEALKGAYPASRPSGWNSILAMVDEEVGYYARRDRGVRRIVARQERMNQAKEATPRVFPRRSKKPVSDA